MKIILKSPQIINEISELLIGAKLVPTELEKNNLYWFGDKNDKDELIAVIGVERYSDICLLRSLAVKAEERNKGIGDKLIKEVAFPRAVRHRKRKESLDFVKLRDFSPHSSHSSLLVA